MQKWNEKSKNKYTAKTAVRKANDEKNLLVKQKMSKFVLHTGINLV